MISPPQRSGRRHLGALQTAQPAVDPAHHGLGRFDCFGRGQTACQHADGGMAENSGYPLTRLTLNLQTAGDARFRFRLLMAEPTFCEP
jgi:hypothetical protein